MCIRDRFTTADEGEGESVGSVSDRDRGHQRFHPFADPGSVAGEVRVVLGEPTAELDDRGTQLSVALAADALAGPGPTSGLVGGRDKARSPVGPVGVGET